MQQLVAKASSLALCCFCRPRSSGPPRAHSQQISEPLPSSWPADAPLMHHTSVAVVPPDEVWQPIQEARTLVRDRGLWRWPPHANLLYPFVAPRHFATAAAVLGARLAGVRPMKASLSEMKLFVHSRRSATLWLHPEPDRAGAWEELEAACQCAFPGCDAQTAGHGGVFTAHFTVGHFGGEEEALRARDEIEASSWQGVSFDVDSVTVMARDGADGQFEPRFVVPIGGGAPRIVLAAHGETAPRFEGMPRVKPPFIVEDQGAGRGKRGRGRGRGRGLQVRLD